jgi:nicotinate-nucleotide adenylyltransferase
VWWLVSPQNPLKRPAETSFEERLAAARRVAAHPSIRVTDIECTMGTVHTVDTLAALRRRFPGTRFVWIIGADNLIQISRWRRWRRIFATVPIAVFARPPYSLKALTGIAARRYAAYRVSETRAGALAGMRPPAWIFFHTRPHPESATRIRAARNSRTERRVGSGKPQERRERAIPTKQRRLSTPNGLLALVTASLDDDKAEDVVVIELAGKTTIADHMVIATGNSQRQVGAMAEHLREQIKGSGIKPVAVEGASQCDWVLIDAGDVIIHLFRPEVRAFYQLERMWTTPPAAADTDGQGGLTA